MSRRGSREDWSCDHWLKGVGGAVVCAWEVACMTLPWTWERGLGSVVTTHVLSDSSLWLLHGLGAEYAGHGGGIVYVSYLCYFR